MLNVHVPRPPPPPPPLPSISPPPQSWNFTTSISLSLLIFESHRIYRRRNFIINHFSLVQASNTEFSQPGNRDENRFNFWKNANTRISPFIFILLLAFLLGRMKNIEETSFLFLRYYTRSRIRFVSAKRKINPMGLMESVEARSRWITAIQSVPGVVRSRLNKMNRTGF